MKITRRDGKDERRILTAMIVDSVVCAKITDKWIREGLFKTKYANVIASWCVRYFTKYEKAPKGHIQHLYETWSGKVHDEKVIQLVEKFLDTLSTDYAQQEKEINSNYIIDLAGKHFNAIKLQNLSRDIQSELDIGQVATANDHAIAYSPLEIGRGEGIDVFRDEQAIKEAFTSKSEPLIKYKGALGEFFKDALERDAFIAFMAPEKRGKTWWLIDLAFRAVMQRRRVAFFEAGDMSQNQFMRRLMIRVSKHPAKRSLVEYPISITKDPDQDEAEVDTKTLRFKQGLKYEKAIHMSQKFLQRLKGKDAYMKLSCHPNSTLTVRAIKSTLQMWEREGWVPDVVIVDYMDILDMSHPSLEGRDRINEVWKQMRGLSQQYHCLVATATQADAQSYTAGTINRTHFSEDKRKFAHVTGMVGINQNETEKERNIMRLNWIALRESEYSEKDCVHVATCLNLGNPAVLSYI